MKIVPRDSTPAYDKFTSSMVFFRKYRRKKLTSFIFHSLTVFMIPGKKNGVKNILKKCINTTIFDLQEAANILNDETVHFLDSSISILSP